MADIDRIEELRKVLTNSGLTLESTVKDSGGIDRESVFSFTLSKGKASYSSEFRKGCGLRRWKTRTEAFNTGCMGIVSSCAFSKLYTAGKSVVLPFGKRFIDPQGHFAALTVPEELTIDEVVYALVCDATSVSHWETFEQFAEEYGYDEDSRKAEAIYRKCIETWQGLLRLGLDINALAELFIDY